MIFPSLSFSCTSTVYGLLVPSAAKQSYFAIRALNVELASVKDSHNLRRAGQTVEYSQQSGTINTPTSLALQMRMQWWRDALDEIYQTPKQHASPLGRSLSISCWHSPVVRALHVAHQQSNLTRRFLERLIDAREADLDLNQYSTMEDSIAYAEESVSSLLYLNLECMGVRDDQADEVASHAGVAIGLLTALRATPFRLQHGEIPLPASLFPSKFPYDDLVRAMSLNDKSDDTNSAITLTEANAQIWDEAIRHMAEVASEHLVRAQELQGQVPRQGRTAILPVVPAFHYLSRLRDVEYNLFHPALMNDESKRLQLLLFLGRTWLTGVF